MEYGLPQNLQNKDNERWMGICIYSLLDRGKGIDEASATRICKTQLIDKKGDKTKAAIGVVNSFLDLYSEAR